jgi:hypothetical protein
MSDDFLKAKEERLKAKIARIKEMFPEPNAKEAQQIETAISKAEEQLVEVQKELAESEQEEK